MLEGGRVVAIAAIASMEGAGAGGGIWLNFNPSERLLKETKGVSVYKPMPSANRKQLGCWATQ